MKTITIILIMCLIPSIALAEPLYIWNRSDWKGIKEKVHTDLIELKAVLDFAFDKSPVGEMVGIGGIMYYALTRARAIQPVSKVVKIREHLPMRVYVPKR